jgi:hypothetical protein
MRTYVAFFTYWAPRSHGEQPEWLTPSDSDLSADNNGRKDDPHFLVAAACAENQPAALKKFRSLLLHLYQTDSRHEVLPSGAAVHLSSLFDLTDVSDTAVVLDWSTVTTLDEGARFFPGIIHMPTADAKRIVQQNPTEKISEGGKIRNDPFVIFPDLR